MMTGARLLFSLIEQMHICSPVELTNYCLRQPATAETVIEAAADLIPLVKEIDEDAFWEMPYRYDWLLPLIPIDGQPKVLQWQEVYNVLPPILQRSSLVIPRVNFLTVVELFVWWFHAPVYASLELNLDGDAEETPTPASKPKTKKNKRVPTSTVEHLTRQARRGGDESLDIYLRQIGETPLISADEEVRLARRIKQGDKQALEQLTKANLRFVVSVAKQYQGSGMALSDLIEDGNIGLIKAAKRFDETRGFKFISYAVWWIRQAILQALAENSRTVRLPLNRVGTLFKIGKVSSRLEQALGRNATPEEIAKELEISEEEVALTLDVGQSSMSLDKPVGEDDGDPLVNLLEDPNSLKPYRPAVTASLRAEIEAVLATLTERQAEIIDLYFGITHQPALKLEQIGARFSLTRERVRQIKEAALRKLRHKSRSEALRSYWSRMD